MECVKIDQCMFGLCGLRDNGHPATYEAHWHSHSISERSSDAWPAAQVRWQITYHQQLDTKKPDALNGTSSGRPPCAGQILEGSTWTELDYLLTLVAFPAESHVELEINSECSEKTYLDGIVTDEDFAAVSASDFAEKKNKKSGRLSTKKEKSHHFRNQLGDHYTDDSNNGDNYHTTHVWLFGDGTT